MATSFWIKNKCFTSLPFAHIDEERQKIKVNKMKDLSKCVICGKLENVLYIPKLKKRKCMDCIIKKIQKNWVTIVHKVQSIETLLDSASQKPDTRKVVMSLHDIRRIQEFFPLQERSLNRFNDSVDENGNYKPHLSKQNYRKYKKMRDIKKGIQLVIDKNA